MASSLPARFLHMPRSNSGFSLPSRSRQLVFLQLRPAAWSTRLSPSSVRSASSSSPPPPPPPPLAATFVPPPTETSGPLLERLPNRALPDVDKSQFKWAHTLPLFLILCGVCSVAIFNYQKSTSPTVASILYALRTNQAVRDVLGDEIYFASKVPWISGELNPLHGRINITFWVKGTKTTGLVRFVCLRRRNGAFFETLEWSLKTDDGTELQLLELGAEVDLPANNVEGKHQL